MVDTRLLLAATWVALMLTYLLGDVIRIFAGDFVPGTIGGVPISQRMLVGLALLMAIPILMILLTLMLPQPVDRWANIGVAIFFFGFNAIGLPGYPGAYDKVLIVAGLAINALTVWLAWWWV